MTYLAWLAVIGLIVALGETARRLYGRLRRHEKTLRESEARYRALLEHPDHIVLVLQAERDARGAVRDWVFRDANTRAAELIGFTREELCGERLTSVAPDRAERIATVCASVLKTRAPTQYEARNGDREFQITVYPMNDSTVVTSATDITERKRAERALRAREAQLRDSEARFRSLADGAPVAIGMSRRGRHLYVNPAFRQCFRVGENDEVVGASIFDYIVPEEHERVREHIRRRYSGEEIPLHYEFTGLRRDGTRFPATADIGQIELPDGPVTLGFIVDVTERRRLEAELRETISRLAEADRRKDEFLATLSHELRNPLAPIRTAVQFMRLKETPDPELQNARDIVDRQVRHMTRLVDDLLDISRISCGRIPLQRVRVNLAVAIQNAVEASRPGIDAARHELRVHLPDETLYVDGDLARLSQIFANLLHNAAKYTPAGGRIELTLGVEHDQALVRIADSGIGIPKEMLSRIFDMFAQVETSLERAQGGLGIGLTLAQQLAQLHGGRIEAHSPGAGLGSIFSVYLPLADVAGGAAADSELSAFDAPVTRRVLVADDNSDAAESLSMLLQMLGHEVHTVHDGLEAVRAAEALQPEVALLDIGMPKLNGYEAARRIRALPGGGTIRLIALTGWGQEQDKHLANDAGFDYHFTKPVDPDVLAALLARATSAPTGSARHRAPRQRATEPAVASAGERD